MQKIEDPIYSTHQNLFRTKEWSAWFHSFTGSRDWIVTPGPYSLTTFRPLEGFFSDYEDPKWHPEGPTPKAVDWIVVRKLFRSEAPLHASFYSNALYLNFSEPQNPKADKIAHIRRTTRKVEREVGPTRLERAHTTEELTRFLHHWSGFHLRSDHLGERELRIWKTLLLRDPLPEWVRPYLLYAGSAVLACGLFFVYDRVFYFYSPATNPDPNLRKYGGGKILTQNLIDLAQKEGCEAFDFLQGDHEYKKHWNPRSRPLFQDVRPLTLKGKILYLLFKLKGRLKK